MRFLLLLLAFAAGTAQADVRVRIAGTDPAAEATLGRDQQFFVRIQFDADEPVGLWTHAYASGKRIEKGYKSNASAKWSGSGYALGWISFDKPVEVDEIRIVAGGRQALSRTGGGDAPGQAPVGRRAGRRGDRAVGARAPARDRGGVGGGASRRGGETRDRGRPRARAS